MGRIVSLLRENTLYSNRDRKHIVRPEKFRQKTHNEVNQGKDPSHLNWSTLFNPLTPCLPTTTEQSYRETKILPVGLYLTYTGARSSL